MSPKPISNRPTALGALALAAALILVSGCHQAHGRPAPGAEVARPGEITDFHLLYRENCAGCHGEDGKSGAAIALANPVYIAWAGDGVLRSAIANGTASELMPPFQKSAGGTLTETQVEALVRGIEERWGKANALGNASPPSYKATLAGDAERGFAVYGIYCARCHGASGEGGPADGNNVHGQSGPRKSGWVGPIVDPSYLALISDQDLRSIVVAGLPDHVMPDWRNDGAQAMTDQQVTDVVRWLGSKRVATPGQPYSTPH